LAADEAARTSNGHDYAPLVALQAAIRPWSHVARSNLLPLLDAHDALIEERDRLRAALKPFADRAVRCDSTEWGPRAGGPLEWEPGHKTRPGDLTIDHCRAARAALAEPPYPTSAEIEAAAYREGYRAGIEAAAKVAATRIYHQHPMKPLGVVSGYTEPSPWHAVAMRHALELDAVRLAALQEGEKLARRRIGLKIGVLLTEERF
jgi:hypothetical protein